jgi:hypothetical protein
MFKIMDKEKLFIPVKSGFPTAAKALDWAKKNLKGSCRPWRLWTPADRNKKYFIQKY